MDVFWKRLGAVTVGAVLIGTVNGMLGIESSTAIIGNMVAGYLLGRIVGSIK